MPEKHLLPKKVADKLYKEFRAKINSIAIATETPLTEDKIVSVFREMLEKTFVIVDEHGNVVTSKDRTAIFTDPGYDPEPGTC